MVYRPDVDATATYWGLTRKQLYIAAAVIFVVAVVILTQIF